jgi:hypothetical protein
MTAPNYYLDAGQYLAAFDEGGRSGRAITKEEHDRAVAGRGRNYTDGPLLRRNRNVAAPDGDGVVTVEASGDGGSK